MINNDRIVPVIKTDLLSLYRVMLGVADIKATNVENNGEIGVFEVTAVEGTTYFCNEPVKKLDISAAQGAYYFVCDYDFEGLFIAGVADSNVADYEFKKDAVTLYCYSPYDGVIACISDGTTNE
jgi:hypothetical protein